MHASPVARLNAALAGRYTLERELGRGGMATVWLTQDLKHDRPVALKVLRPELAAALGPERFLREVRITARLNHPHILPLLDSGDADGFLYYVMPYVAGESLRDRLDREKQLPLDDALQIAREVADALSYAHSRDVVHRDVKPENILLESGHAVVADFGIARAITAAGGEALTQTGIVVGTPAYMSPEQAAGEDSLDGRADLYSLASTLYEMLAGEPPFTGRTAQAVLAKRLTAVPAPLRAMRPLTPPNVESAVARALARSPVDRYPDTAAFAAALRDGLRADSADPLAAALDAETRRSVGVLPFVNLSTDPDNEYFSDGVTEDIITLLSKLPALRVISRTSVMRFKGSARSLREIARELGVTTIVEGSVRKSGNRLRISAQLIDARTDEHLWSDTYDRHLTDVFAIQSEVATSLATALRAQLSSDQWARLQRPRTEDVEAYSLCLQGRHYWHRWIEESFHRSVEYFERAIARDPRCALAHAGRAMAYGTLSLGYWSVPAGAFRNEARESLARALELDAEQSEAIAYSCWLDMQYDYAWERIEGRLREAVHLHPSDVWACDTYAGYLTVKERHAEARLWSERAVALDPLSIFIVGNAALNAHRARDHERAAALADRAISLHPELPMSHLIKALALARTGALDDALVAAERASALQAGVYELGGAAVYAAAGRRSEALRIIRHYEQLRRSQNVWLFGLAMAYAGIGDIDAAIARLEEAYAARDFWVVWLRVQPELDPLRGDERFAELVHKVRLD